MAVNPYRTGSRQNYVAAHALTGKSRRQTYALCLPQLGRRPLLFQKNTAPGEPREPLSERGQRVALWRTINRTFDELPTKVAGWVEDPASKAEGDKPRPKGSAEPQNAGDPEPLEPNALEPDKPTKVEQQPTLVEDHPVERPEGPQSKTAEQFDVNYLLKRVRELRAFCESRKGPDGRPIDEIGMRPSLHGAAALNQGVPVDAILHAVTLDWPENTRREAGVRPFDVSTLAEPIDGKHHLFGYVLKLVAARVPVWLVGPAGSGKSKLAQQVAEHLTEQSGEQVRYAAIPLTAGLTPAWLLGRQRLSSDPAKEYAPAPFVEVYEHGGVFCFEELDAAEPSVLLVVNDALANRRLHNPISGRVIDKSPKFLAMATSNTYGQGADRRFSARERLDAATIDRWRVGRVFVPFDEGLESRLAREIVAGA